MRLKFDALWRDNDVVAHGERLKRIRHPEGLLELECFALAVNGGPELGKVCTIAWATRPGT